MIPTIPFTPTLTRVADIPGASVHSDRLPLFPLLQALQQVPYHMMAHVAGRTEDEDVGRRLVVHVLKSEAEGCSWSGSGDEANIF